MQAKETIALNKDTKVDDGKLSLEEKAPIEWAKERQADISFRGGRQGSGEYS